MKRVYTLCLSFIFCAFSLVVHAQTSAPCNNPGARCNGGAHKSVPSPSNVNNSNATVGGADIKSADGLDYGYGSPALAVSGYFGVAYNNSACGLNYVRSNVLIEQR